MSKKLIWTIVAVVAVIAVAVVAVVFLKPKTEVKNVEGTLEEIMVKLYAGIPQENLPMLGNNPVDAESIESYVGVADISFKEALASEAMIGSIPHSVVLVRLNDAKDADTVVSKIKENANPRKWICVQASNVVVESKGDLVVLIMCDTEMTEAGQELAPKLGANFNNL